MAMRPSTPDHLFFYQGINIILIVHNIIIKNGSLKYKSKMREHATRQIIRLEEVLLCDCLGIGQCVYG